MYHGRTTGKGASTPTQIYERPPRILIVHIALPSWADICSNLCEALQNFFSLACNLMGPSRMSLFSLYLVQNQHECILPFVQVKGNFAKLQACMSELRMLQREGCFRPQGTSLQLAVEDGLQQFKQYSRHVTTGTALSCTSLEITILTSQPGKEVVKQLEEGLKDIDLVRVRRLQVVEITKGALDYTDAASPGEEPSSDESSILGTDIDLQTIDNDIVSMESFFKAWLHNSGTDQEHIHLLLPSQSFSNISRGRDNPMCLKCDLQERLLSPSLLPGTADGSLRMDDPKGDFSTIYQMACQSWASRYKLRVIKALKSSGVCESVTYGLPFILRPTSCWQLDWDELETNQQHFHALCHSLLKREWLLLAKGEPQSRGHSLREPPSTFYVIVPSRSPTLLVKAVATRELMLPSAFPLLPEDPPDDSLKIVEGVLDGLELEPTYNPLQICSRLYSHLNSTFAKPQGRLHPSWESRALRKHPGKAGQLQANRVRATVAPLPMTTAPGRAPKVPAASKASSEALFQFSKEEEDEEEEYPSGP
ncbi:meiosis 1 associated protein [Rhinolophus ferrumequinum]|uniref:Meiosis 1 associated protein n=1 Tax=Rhinolophus ferrumequinum TaxID=59479 RepID=A0A671E746_RHIFE|nr:meiosis 1 arrest protein isoform X1 [Rhinolophus ferrumequinum]KAF6321385.1 meiosis 1 associated protein [Rhinolophus ferrumequinum]